MTQNLDLILELMNNHSDLFNLIPEDKREEAVNKINHNLKVYMRKPYEYILNERTKQVSAHKKDKL
jgi:hypothetical protein